MNNRLSLLHRLVWTHRVRPALKCNAWILRNFHELISVYSWKVDTCKYNEYNGLHNGYLLASINIICWVSQIELAIMWLLDIDLDWKNNIFIGKWYIFVEFRSSWELHKNDPVWCTFVVHQNRGQIPLWQI